MKSWEQTNEIGSKRNRRFEQTYNSKGIELVILKFPTEKKAQAQMASVLSWQQNETNRSHEKQRIISLVNIDIKNTHKILTTESNIQK